MLKMLFQWIIRGGGLIALSLSAHALENLEVLSPNYPRAGYFRVAETTIRDQYDGNDAGYTEWRDSLSDLSGIMGKTEYEELVRNNPHEQILDWFQRYKQDFPDKYVMVHFNGRGRVPNYRLDEFFAGHWLHFEGCGMLSDLPEESDAGWVEEVWVEVEDPSRFKLDNGRNDSTPDDITLVRRNPDGSLNWNYAEEVRLKDIDSAGSRILIKRSMFNTPSLQFSATNTHAAAHIMGGPWGDTVNMVWYGNFSTECPRDSQGRTYVDVLSEELAANFAPGGHWETFDGVEFDVMQGEPGTGYHKPHRAEGNLADVDGDGVKDDGMIGGLQTYGLGVYQFLEDLRTAVGTNKIIAADGRADSAQKAGSGVLNGVEMEGMPAQDPTGFSTWSTPLNMLDFWSTAVGEPTFNYGAVRYKGVNDLSEAELFRYYRLAIAAASFTDSFIMASSWNTNSNIPRLDQVLDRGGPATGWLGAPTGDTVHLAAESPDELLGRGNPFSSDVFLDSDPSVPWLKRNTWEQPATMFINAAGNLEVAPEGAEESFKFKIMNAPFASEQAYVEMRIRSKGAVPGYPADYNRLLVAQVDGVTAKQKNLTAYFNDGWQVVRFYFANTVNLVEDTPVLFNTSGQERLNLEFTVWGPSAPVEIEYVTVHDAPEVVYRPFESGAIVANLSETNYTFSMATYLPSNYHHIQGSQDSDVNSGMPVGEDLSVGPKDAVFLWKPVGYLLFENKAWPGEHLKASDGANTFDLVPGTAGKVQWELVPTGETGRYYLENKYYNGQRLKADSINEFSMTTETGPALEWRIMPAGEGLYFLENGFYTNQVLTSDDGANDFSLSSIGAALDGSKWRLTAAPSWLEALGLVEGPSGDDDKDGESNLLEYGLGGDPLNPAILAEQPALQESAESGFDYIYLRRIGGNLDYQVEHSTDLKVWNDAEYEVTGQNGDRGDGYEYIINHLPEASESKQFIRLRIEER